MNNLVGQLATFHSVAPASLRNSCVCVLLAAGSALMAVGFYFLLTEPDESWFKFWMREIPSDVKHRDY